MDRPRGNYAQAVGDLLGLHAWPTDDPGGVRAAARSTGYPDRQPPALGNAAELGTQATTFNYASFNYASNCCSASVTAPVRYFKYASVRWVSSL
jgi:hypothetical protein